MKRVLCVLLTLFLMGFFTTPLYAQSSDINRKIEELQRKISELQSQENSLSKQIGILNSQISLTTLQIESIKSAIIKLTQEADQLAVEIDRLEELLTRRSLLVLKRVPESYKRNATSQFGLLFLSHDFQDFIHRVKYISRVQSEDAQLLLQLKSTQNNFAERKLLRVTKKEQQVVLQRQLEIESRKLDQQKREKQILLDQTRNSESIYQKLLAQALSEYQALKKALIEGVKVGPVKKGDPIALVGNTGYPGCSTGSHLHFEIQKNNSWVDPAGYLSSKSVIDEQNGGSTTLGSGGWDWPLSDQIRLTQHFGKTPYSYQYKYSGEIHTGYDMVSSSSEIIRAPNDGTLYASNQVCRGSSIIKIKYIDHGNGVLSFYLHVQ